MTIPAKQLPKTANFILVAWALVTLNTHLSAADETTPLKGVPEGAHWAVGIDLVRVLESMPMNAVARGRFEDICAGFESRTGKMLGQMISPTDFHRLVVLSEVEAIKSPSAMILETSFDMEATLLALRTKLVESTDLDAADLPAPHEDPAVGPFLMFQFRNEVSAAQLGDGIGAVARHPHQLTAIHKHLSDSPAKKHPLITPDEYRSLASDKLIAWIVHDNVNAMYPKEDTSQAPESNQDRNTTKIRRLFFTISAPENGESHWRGVLKLMKSHSENPSATTKATTGLQGSITINRSRPLELEPGQAQPGYAKILNLIRQIANDGLEIQIDNGDLTAHFSIHRPVLEQFRDSLFDQFEAQFNRN